jgi:hypothetical protein
MAQTEQPVRHLMDAGDLKKLGKADGYKADADRIMEEINLLNIQIISLEADSAVSTATIRKRTTSLENQTWQKYDQAGALYEKGNQIKFDVYKSKIEHYWKTHPGSETTRLNEKLLEEQSSDRWFQAHSYRMDARRMSDGKVKATRLTEASSLEGEALDKLITALAGCHDIDLGATHVTADNPFSDTELAEADRLADSVLRVSDTGEMDKTVPENSGINQAEIDRYNRYMAEGQRTDTTLSTGKIAGITRFDRDTVLTLWYEYLYNRDDSARAIALSKPDTPVQEKVLPAEKAVPADQAATEIGRVTEENRLTLIPADEEVIYRVQIAANRTELTQRALSRIYYGSKNVEMENENGWFKYTVGDFSTYEEANRFRKTSGVENAFVMAYRKGKRLTDKPGLDIVAEGAGTVGDTARNLRPGLVFRIQVAASRVPLAAGQLEQLLGAHFPVEMVQEDGWYKYQLIGVRDFSDAIRLKQEVAAKGAFVVAYNNGIKQKLADAVNGSRNSKGREGATSGNTIPEDTEFHVQVAAVKRMLKPSEIRKLYEGNLPVCMVMEDGWYKYQIKTGNAYAMARNIVRDCHVDGAFIVPYRNAVKISLREAILPVK